MAVTYETLKSTHKTLTGEWWSEYVSDQVFTLLGAKASAEPQWTLNQIGGSEHYEYGGEKCYVPWLYVEDEKTGNRAVFSLNGEFVNVPFPDPIPQEWGTSGRKFVIVKATKEIYWLHYRVVKDGKTLGEFPSDAKGKAEKMAKLQNAQVVLA